MTALAEATDRQQILDAIVAALSDVLRQELTGVTEQTRLFDDLSLDSTSVLGLLMALEDALDMQVDPENLEQRHLETVGALADFIVESR
ncbi:acyl carrier protein [Solwaraspora sp. WMMB335]|uniref:acyl carrier protein n=1 Tax=Solwaraspora sp. WMMB335 TaxID=3404118 RepID=UPI003B933C4A